MSSPIIRVTDLCKDYETALGPFPVLKNVNVSISAGEYVAIMGPSGSGKSTFMNILGCLDKPTSGEYALDGHLVSELYSNQLARIRNQTIGFVFQGFSLLMRSNLLDNIALPLVYAGTDKKVRHERARVLLEKVGLGKYPASMPNQISGGQQQRIAIARALINRPRLILADEPTGNLDSKTSEDIMRLFAELNEEGITIIIVTHEADIASHARRQVRFLDGRIVHDAPATEAPSRAEAETA